MRALGTQSQPDLTGPVNATALLGGQRALPNKALSRGFGFRHETLRSAFKSIS